MTHILHEENSSALVEKKSVTVVYNNDGSASITIPFKNLKRIDDFLQRKCFLDLMRLGIFPDCKEISEAECMRNACVFKLKLKEKNEKTAVVIIGDGKYPRFGCLLAFTTLWKIYSIDPLLSFDPIENGVRNLYGIKSHVQNIKKIEWERIPERVIVCAPHSHGDLNEGLKLIKRSINISSLKEINFVASPCCVVQRIEDKNKKTIPCHKRYADLGNWSNKGSFMLWKFTNSSLVEPEKRISYLDY